MIAIVDYDMGNVASVANMLKRAGSEAVLTRDPAVLADAERIILPGVGAFDQGMRNLERLGLRAPLEDAVVKNKVPVLGICLGMHLLTKRSEEGDERGLGWIEAETHRFSFSSGSDLKVPHMGWAYVIPTRANALVDSAISNRFYFVHAYYVECSRPEDVAATTSHGIPFTSILQRDNVYGVQFHPEKSHKFGMKLLSEFARL